MASRYEGQNVLIPASDDCSLYMARHSERLETAFALMNPSAHTMEKLKDKRRQYELAAAADVPIPETYFPADEKDAAEIAGRISNYPYIIKPLEAQKWRLQRYENVAQGQKAIVVKDPEQLVAEYRRIAAHDSEIMIQEIIGGRDEHLLTLLGYCSADKKPLAHCIRSKLRQSPVDFGYCTATVSCHEETVEKYSQRLLESCGYNGIVGIEFKYDPLVHDYKLIEINTRPVNTLGLSIGAGVNLPLIGFRDVTGEAQEVVDDWQDGVIWIRLHNDFRAARELRRLGRLTYIEWLRSIRGKRVHAVLAFDDLAPWVQVYSRYVAMQLRRVALFPGRLVPTRFTRRLLSRVSSWML
jgi:predicted ATP-grasp superfamily ATP-dependent carboligase